jgi:hypothetical protein
MSSKMTSTARTMRVGGSLMILGVADAGMSSSGKVCAGKDQLRVGQRVTQLASSIRVFGVLRDLGDLEPEAGELIAGASASLRSAMTSRRAALVMASACSKRRASMAFKLSIVNAVSLVPFPDIASPLGRGKHFHLAVASEPKQSYNNASANAAIIKSRLPMRQADVLLYAPPEGWLRPLP